MPDQDWQHAVLHDLGVSRLGLATPDTPRPVLAPVPVTDTAPRPAPVVSPATGQETGPSPLTAPTPTPPSPAPAPTQVTTGTPVPAGPPVTPAAPGPMGVPRQTRRPAAAAEEPAQPIRPETVMFQLPVKPSVDDSATPIVDPTAVIRPHTVAFPMPGRGPASGGATDPLQVEEVRVAPLQDEPARGSAPQSGTEDAAPAATPERVSSWYSEPPSSGDPQAPASPLISHSTPAPASPPATPPTPSPAHGPAEQPQPPRPGATGPAPIQPFAPGQGQGQPGGPGQPGSVGMPGDPGRQQPAAGHGTTYPPQAATPAAGQVSPFAPQQAPTHLNPARPADPASPPTPAAAPMSAESAPTFPYNPMQPGQPIGSMPPGGFPASPSSSYSYPSGDPNAQPQVGGYPQPQQAQWPAPETAVQGQGQGQQLQPPLHPSAQQQQQTPITPTETGPQQAQQQAAPGGAASVYPPAQELTRKNKHGDPMMRRVGRGMRKVIGASAAQDARVLAEVVDKLGSPVATCRQIAVTSVRGGAGKTTVAALTASMMAKYRDDRVLTIDADSGLGSLPLRLGARSQLSLHDLATTRPGSWEDATRYLAQTPTGLWVLSGTTGGQLADELEIDQFETAFSGVGRYFSTAVVDCGAGLVNRLQRGILSGSHGQILVTPGTVDGALSALGAIDWFNANGFAGLLPRSVIALVTHTPHADSDLDKAVGMLGSGGMPVIHIPYDRHLATGTAIDLQRISEAARTAATRIAAEVFSRSVGR